MQVADGFEVSLVASEPEIRQPVSVTFDERGRMWVIQYLQYPTPAGLKPVRVDNYLRTTYDRRPEPPPRGPNGADRITICELSEDRKRAVTFKDFVTGLNLCTGMIHGHGGLFVVQAPYLLFYPDRNRDDVPDSDPEVLLTGFGMEDAHAFANSLTWGPDGWLYGAQGSTVTANIHGIEFQQGIWRYHPLTKEFELFAEGGGNTWGLDFDERGEILAGTNFDEKMLHQVQGAYYLKNFGKHGALHNPYAYGYFGHVPYSGYRGPHLSSGGIVYQGHAFPASFTGTYIFANVLDHAVYWASLKPQGSSFTAAFGGPLLKTDDEQFRPVDCELGPGGAVYIADWCDKRATHLDPLDTWDRSNGRIYRIQNLNPSAPSASTPNPGRTGFDLQKLSSNQLVDLLDESNVWFARKARLLLAERRDARVLPRLRKQILDNQNPRLALQSFWALYVSGGFDEKLAGDLLKHSDQNIRAWTVRLVGDTRKVSAATQRELDAAARWDASPIVRAQLACSAKRLPGENALPIVTELLGRDEDVNDPHIPMLIWWAIEDKAIAHRQRVMRLFSSPDVWQRPIIQKFILERLARRYADEGGEAGFATCAQLLERAPESGATGIMLQGMDQALAGRKLSDAPAALSDWFAKAWQNHSEDVAYVRLGLRLGQAQAKETAIKILNDQTTPETVATSLIEVIGQTETPNGGALCLALLEQARSEQIRESALGALRHFPQDQVAEGLLEIYPRLNRRLQLLALNLLSSRLAWARLLVGAVEAGRIEAKDVTLENLRQIAAASTLRSRATAEDGQDADLNRQIEKRWGKIQPDSPEEKRNSINRLKLLLIPSGTVGRETKGNFAEGKKVFQATCAICHKLFGEGNSVGPDLTSADRKNVDSLLANIVTPSAYIRPEFVSFSAGLKDDSVIDGLMVKSTPSAITLLDRNNTRHLLAREQIRELRESAMSLMPEGLLEALSPRQVIDLFAYLQANDPAAAQSASPQSSTR
jgi:putative membrane-bound dehydrogenase-like protein